MIMKKTLRFFLCLTALLLAFAQPSLARGYWKGDINGSCTKPGTKPGDTANCEDAGVTILDLCLMVRMLNEEIPFTPAADMNNDGKLTLADVDAMIELLLGNRQSVWHNHMAIIGEDGDALGDGGDAGDTPPPADAKEKKF